MLVPLLAAVSNYTSESFWLVLNILQCQAVHVVSVVRIKVTLPLQQMILEPVGLLVGLRTSWLVASIWSVFEIRRGR